MKGINALAFFMSLILSYIGGPMIYNMLYKSQTTGRNYKDEKIPVSMGLLFVFVQSITMATINFISLGEFDYILEYLFGFLLVGLVGLLDDLIGDEDVKGFKGHIKSFFKGNLTTGAIKAGVGFLVALFISINISKNFFELILNTLIIALFTNLTNLFDLRPGRSIKMFLVVSIIILLSGYNSSYNFILYSFYGILLVYFPWDLKAKSMMGDIGSNTLGFTLGVFCVLTSSLYFRLFSLFLLVIAHVLAEKFSFSTVIEKNKLLNYLDKLGRGE